MCEGGFTKTWWAIEENVFGGVSPLTSRGEENPEVLLHFLLSDVLIPAFWAELLVESAVQLRILEGVGPNFFLWEFHGHTIPHPLWTGGGG